MGRYDIEQSLSFYLFARPGFSEGMGRVLDMGSTTDVYNDNASPEQADAKAIASDWLMVGQDIKNSIYEYERQLFHSSKPQ